MHYHVGSYTGDGRLIHAEGFTRIRERAEADRESAAVAQAEAYERELSAVNYRGAVIDDISDPDYTDREPRPFHFPAYVHRVIDCSIAPAHCMATYETVMSSRRARSR